MLHNIQRGEYALSLAVGESISTLKIFQVGTDIKPAYFLSFVCPKERNKEKGSQKQMLRSFWQANAHVQSLCFEITFLIELIG